MAYRQDLGRYAAYSNDKFQLADIACVLRLPYQSLARLNTLERLNDRTFDYPDNCRLAAHVKNLVARSKQDAEYLIAKRRRVDLMDTDVPDVVAIDK